MPTIKVNGKAEIEKTFHKFLDKKLKYLSNKKGFLGIDNKFNFREKVIIIPFGLEKTVSYGGGTKNGPKEIIKASHQVELYDEELNCEPYKKIGIKTLRPFKIHKNINKALKKMESVNKEILDKKERIWSMQNPLEERLLMQIAKQIREASSKNTIENFEALCKVTAQDQYN